MKTKKIAMITGASSGIGEAFATHLARLGYDLIITGRRGDKLSSIKQRFSAQFGISVKTILAELSREKDVLKVIREISRHTDIFVLVNNAGFGSGIEFCKNKLDNHLQMLQVHVVAAIKLVYAVMPQMITRREGTIINVSSLGAFMPAPGNSMYSATKLFMKNFSESLHMEVHQYGIHVQCLCPGFTHTDFHNRLEAASNAHFNRLMWMEADTVVEKSWHSLEGKNIVYVPGIINKLLVRIAALLPRRVYYYFMETTRKLKENDAAATNMENSLKLTFS